MSYRIVKISTLAGLVFGISAGCHERPGQSVHGAQTVDVSVTNSDNVTLTRNNLRRGGLTCL